MLNNVINKMFHWDAQTCCGTNYIGFHSGISTLRLFYVKQQFMCFETEWKQGLGQRRKKNVDKLQENIKEIEATPDFRIDR